MSACSCAAEAALPLLLAGFLFLVPAEIDDVGFLVSPEAQRVFGDGGLALPFGGFGGAAGGRQRVSIGAEQPGAVGKGAVDVQLRDFQFGNRGVELSEVGAGAGGDDGQFHLARGVEILGFLGAGHVQGTVRAAKATFAVGHDRQVHVGAADPAVGPEFPKRLAIVAGCVGGQADSFADGREASAAAAGRQGMLEGKLRLLVQKASGHDEVAGHPFGAVGFEGLDLVLRGAVKFLARDVLVDLG